MRFLMCATLGSSKERYMAIFESLSTTDLMYICITVFAAIYLFLRGRAGIQPKAMFTLSGCLLVSAILLLLGQEILALVFGGAGMALIYLLRFSEKQWKLAKRKKNSEKS